VRRIASVYLSALMESNQGARLQIDLATLGCGQAYTLLNHYRSKNV
jgi:hypothetical protein